MVKKALAKRKKSTNKEKRLKTNQYSYFQALRMSFYSSALYVDVKQRWGGLGLIYLLLLSAILSIPWALVEGVKYYRLYQSEVIPAVKQIPVLKVKDGAVQFDKKMPYVIKSKKTNKPIIIIDTTGKTKALKGHENPSVLILITKHKIFTRAPNLAPNFQRISPKTTGTLGPKEFMIVMKLGKSIFLASLYPMLVSILFVADFIVLVLISFIVMFFSKMLLKYEINYRDSIRLACVATTPQLCALFVIHLMGWSSNATSLLLFCILFGYFVFALRANKHAPKQLVPL